MKLLQICSYYTGSALYQNLFEALEKKGIQEDVYVFVDYGYKVEKTYPSNVCISKDYRKIDRIFFHLKHFKVLKKIKQNLVVSDYDLMHSHSLFSNGYIAYKLKQRYGIPYIVAVRNTDVNVFFKKMIFLRNLGINIMKNAEQIVFLSNSYKRYVIDNFIPFDKRKCIENKSLVIPNGIDRFWLENKYEKKHLGVNSDINLIYVGDIDANKNIETTIKVCKCLIGQGYDVNYKIIGDIIDTKYKKLIKRHKFIKYIPFCRKEELINHYRKSDIFVMPSKYETFGLVYAEAMSQGLPIIYTRGQGFDGQFKEGEVGYSVQYNSSEEIVERIKDILNNYETISNNCIEKVDRFDWDNIAKEYLILYRELGG